MLEIATVFWAYYAENSQFSAYYAGNNKFSLSFLAVARLQDLENFCLQLLKKILVAPSSVSPYGNRTCNLQRDSLNVIGALDRSATRTLMLVLVELPLYFKQG